jgi:Ohr subfamily peroxiredoxin
MGDQRIELSIISKNRITKTEINLMSSTGSSAEVGAAQSKKVLYTAKAHTTGGREGGASQTSDGRLDVKFSLPGGPGNGTNPEQLFAVGWSGCFTSAIKHVAAGMKVRVPADMAVDAEVDLCSGDDGYSIQARLNVSLPGLAPEVARAIVDAAHKTCPYSKATRGNIPVTLNVV